MVAGASDKCNLRQKVGKNTKLYVMLDLMPNFKINFKTQDSILQNLQEFYVRILLYFCSYYSFSHLKCEFSARGECCSNAQKVCMIFSF